MQNYVLTKIFSVLRYLRSGRFYINSNKRKKLVNSYQKIIKELNTDDYKIFKDYLIHQISELVKERNERKISYYLISKIIEYSCVNNDLSVYFEYEKEVLKLVSKNKEKNLSHFITLANTRYNLLSDISQLEDYFIKRYLRITYNNNIIYRYLLNFTSNVRASNKIKFLRHLIRSKPFANEYIIRFYIECYPELNSYKTLI